MHVDQFQCFRTFSQLMSIYIITIVKISHFNINRYAQPSVFLLLVVLECVFLIPHFQKKSTEVSDEEEPRYIQTAYLLQATLKTDMLNRN